MQNLNLSESQTLLWSKEIDVYLNIKTSFSMVSAQM